MLTASYDEQLGIIRSVSRGMTEPAELESYVVQLRTLRDEARNRGQRFLHLVDAIEGAVQAKWAGERLSIYATSDLNDPSDRTAIVVNSALVKMQIARLTSHTQFATFVSEAAAIDWLCSDQADKQPRQAASQ